MNDLYNRIAEALAGNPASGNLAQLAQEAGKALAEANAAHDAAKRRALDPKTPANVVGTSRREMEDARFRADRLSNAVTELNDRLTRAIEAERAAEAAERLDVAEQRQRAGAELLRDRYPILAAEIADILAECKAADQDVRRAGGRSQSVIIAGYTPNSIGHRDSNPLTFTQLAAPRAAFPERRGTFWPIR